jgi:hypothetical protein
VELKYLKLEKYDYQVQERRKREHFVVEHQLLSEEHHKRMLSQGIAQNNARKELKGYTRFMSGKEEERLVGYLTLQSTLSATIRELSQRRRGSSNQSFEQKYRELADRREQKSLANGQCPMDLKVVASSS